MEMTKKNQKKKQGQELTVKSLLKISFLSLAMAFVIAYTFSTEFFPKKSKELIAHKKTYKPIITKRDIALQNAISLEEVKEIIASSNKELQKYTKEKNNIIAKDRVLGYTSLRVFLLSTGDNLLSFTVSLFFLFIVVNHINDRLMKRYYLIASFVFVVTAGYWLFWSVLNFSLDPKRGFDFPKSWYYISIYILPTLVFFTAYFWNSLKTCGIFIFRQIIFVI